MNRRSYFPIGCGALIFIWVVVAVIADYRRTEESKRWQSIPQSDFPKPFLDLLAEADKRQISYKNVEILYRKPDDALFWKTDFSQELLDLMLEQWKLMPDKQITARTQTMLDRIPPNFISNQTANIDIYADPDWIVTGEARNQSSVIRDKANNKLVVKVYFYH